MNGAQEALTGQTITAKLSVSGTITSATWTVTGSVFKTWSETTIPQKVDLGSKDYSPMLPYAPPSTPLTFNDATAETVTVGCSGTYTDAKGVSHPANPTSQTVMFMKPTVTAWGINTGTNVQNGLLAGVTGGFGSGSGAIIYGTELWGPITIGNTTLGGTNVGGVGCVAQIVQSVGTAAMRSPDASYVAVVPDGNGGLINLPPNCLDTGFPFPFGYNLSGGVMDLAHPLTTSQFTLPNSGYSGDQPKVLIFPNTTDNWTKTIESNTFNTWVMYEPPGGIWVPLQMLTWDFKNTAMPTAGGSITDPVDNKTLWDVPFMAFPDGGSPANTQTYPQWSATDAGLGLGVPTSP